MVRFPKTGGFLPFRRSESDEQLSQHQEAAEEKVHVPFLHSLVLQLDPQFEGVTKSQVRQLQIQSQQSQCGAGAVGIGRKCLKLETSQYPRWFIKVPADPCPYLLQSTYSIVFATKVTIIFLTCSL